MALSGIDIRVIVHEIKEAVEKSWIVNIYELPGKIFIFKLRQPQEGLKFLLIEPGKRIHLTNFNREMPREPTNFATTLRSHLRNTMINWIEQKEVDRIVKLSIGPEPSYTLVIELFGDGNMILVNPKGKITNAVRYRKMRDRDIHPGRQFREMPAQERDLLRNGTTGLRDIFKEIDRLVPALNTWLGLGPYYSRYLLKTVDIKKKNVEDLTEDEIETIIGAASDLKRRLEEHDYDPIVYLEPEEESEDQNSQPEDDLDYDDQWGDEALPFRPEDVIKIFPWPQPIVDEEELKKYRPDHLYEAYDVFYSSQETQEIVEGESEQLNTVMDKLETQLEEQTKHMKRMEQMGEIYRNYADALYANFQVADELISTVYNAKKNNMEWETIIGKLEEGKKKGMSAAQIFDKIDPDNAKMYLTLPHLDQEYDVSVDFRKSLTDNANDYYQEAKKSDRKAKGAAKAIEITKEKIEKASEEVEEMVDRQREKVVILKRRKSWYEKFHWSKTPNDTLIIGGFDASSNEKLVKRYLEDDDLFVHANLQGASAVIIKGGVDSNETTKRIAGQLAVSYSSGWKAKLQIADAFLVEKEQVSLTPPSGEYLPKGSFMIYGEKSFVNDAPLEMCIGVVVEKYWARVISGTEECMGDADYYVKVVPGSDSRGKIAKQVQNKFKSMADDISAQKIDALDVGDLAWYIPGDSKIVEYRNQTE